MDDDSIRSEIARLERLQRIQPGDPGIQLDLGRALFDASEHERALEVFLECFDHSLDHRRSFSGVRGTYLLEEILRLGEFHPPAITALKARRDQAREVLLAPLSRAETTVSRIKLDFEAAMKLPAPRRKSAKDLLLLNRVLDEESESIHVFKQIPQTWNPKLRVSEANGPSCSRPRDNPYPILERGVRRILIDQRRYEEFLKLVAHPLDELHHEIERAGQGRSSPALSASTHSRSAKIERVSREILLRNHGLVYEALLGSKAQDATAERFQKSLMEYDNSFLAWRTLLAHANRAGRLDCCSDLLSLAAEALASSEIAKLKEYLR